MNQINIIKGFVALFLGFSITALGIGDGEWWSFVPVVISVIIQLYGAVKLLVNCDGLARLGCWLFVGGVLFYMASLMIYSFMGQYSYEMDRSDPLILGLEYLPKLSLVLKVAAFVLFALYKPFECVRSWFIVLAAINGFRLIDSVLGVVWLLTRDMSDSMYLAEYGLRGLNLLLDFVMLFAFYKIATGICHANPWSRRLTQALVMMSLSSLVMFVILTDNGIWTCAVSLLATIFWFIGLAKFRGESRQMMQRGTIARSSRRGTGALIASGIVVICAFVIHMLPLPLIGTIIAALIQIVAYVLMAIGFFKLAGNPNFGNRSSDAMVMMGVVSLVSIILAVVFAVVELGAAIVFVFVLMPIIVMSWMAAISRMLKAWVTTPAGAIYGNDVYTLRAKARSDKEIADVLRDTEGYDPRMVEAFREEWLERSLAVAPDATPRVSMEVDPVPRVAAQSHNQAGGMPYDNTRFQSVAHATDSYVNQKMQSPGVDGNVVSEGSRVQADYMNDDTKNASSQDAAHQSQGNVRFDNPGVTDNVASDSSTQVVSGRMGADETLQHVNAVKSAFPISTETNEPRDASASSHQCQQPYEQPSFGQSSVQTGQSYHQPQGQQYNRPGQEYNQPRNDSSAYQQPQPQQFQQNPIQPPVDATNKRTLWIILGSVIALMMMMALIVVLYLRTVDRDDNVGESDYNEQAQIDAEALSGTLLYEDGVSAYQRGDYGAARGYFDEVISMGYASDAQADTYYYLGQMAENGLGDQSKDQNAALQYYIQGADNDDAKSQCEYGVALKNGRGVQRDYARAHEMYRRAANAGMAKAQVHLGAMFENGQGTVKNDAEAAAWYRKAAEQFDPLGQYYLGDMYHYGKGVVQDLSQARHYYQLAADQGNADAAKALRSIQ